MGFRVGVSGNKLSFILGWFRRVFLEEALILLGRVVGRTASAGVK